MVHCVRLHWPNMDQLWFGIRLIKRGMLLGGICNEHLHFSLTLDVLCSHTISQTEIGSGCYSC